MGLYPCNVLSRSLVWAQARGFDGAGKIFHWSTRKKDCNEPPKLARTAKGSITSLTRISSHLTNCAEGIRGRLIRAPRNFYLMAQWTKEIASRSAGGFYGVRSSGQLSLKRKADRMRSSGAPPFLIAGSTRCGEVSYALSRVARYHDLHPDFQYST